MKSELFLLTVQGLYDDAVDAVDDRFAPLVREAAVADPQWTAAFLKWLRAEPGLRPAALAGALEAARAMLAAGRPGSRRLVESVLLRADDPGEALSYWVGRYGRAIPKPVKRGVADAVARLYTEPAMLRHDTATKGFRFADVIDLVHPAPAAPWQGDLFKVALERRHHRDDLSLDSLPMVSANALLREAAADPAALFEMLRDPARLEAAGMTWQGVLSLAGSNVDKRLLWRAVVPMMGYLALLANLRRFDEADIHDDVAAAVSARLADPARVARSRQLPLRFVAVHERAPSLRWGPALERALQASLANLPATTGRTLVLVDTSASMTASTIGSMAGSVGWVPGSLTPAKTAAVFSVALAAGTGARLHGFAGRHFHHEVPRGASILKEANRFLARTGEAGHATDVAEALRGTYSGQDRVIVISDTRHEDADFSLVPKEVPLFAINLGESGPSRLVMRAHNRYELGDLSDATFRLIPLLEAARDCAWPWEKEAGEREAREKELREGEP
ncbi:MAG TPA: TROVE domain-containing protein [Candidatus Limnocylindrales bacterium]|nr:TROVE domain-containing protein [Candidatus Limnocylindrales bacterium]